MRYKTRPILCGIITLALSFAAQAAAFEHRVSARVKRVIDGDTFTVEAMLWPGIIAQSSVRVRGVDTPEIRNAKCGEYERQRGRAARDFVRGIIGEHVAHQRDPRQFRFSTDEEVRRGVELPRRGRACGSRTGATSPRSSSPPAMAVPTGADDAVNGVEGLSAPDKWLINRFVPLVL